MKLLYVFLLPLLFACSFKKEQPITDAEATAYAKDMQASIKAGDKNILNRVLDEDLFADEVVKAANAGSEKGLKEGVKTGLKRQNLSRQIFQALGDDGTYEFVRQYQKDGGQHVIFRLFGDGGLNYHDFALVKYDGKIKAKDIYIFLSGENLSQTMGGLAASMMKQADNSTANIKNQSATMLRLKSLVQQKKLEEAKRLFDGLPADLRKSRAFQLVNMQITADMDESVYAEALSEFEKLYGNDPSVQFALFDHYFFKGEYDRLLRVLDGVDKTVHDPLLDYYRSLIQTKKGDDATAIKYLEALYKNKPDFQAGALELLANYMNQNQIEKAASVAAAYKANKDFNQEKLRDVMALYPDAAERMKR